MAEHWTHHDPAVRELIAEAEERGRQEAVAAVENVRRYAALTLSSISVERRAMAEDVLSLLTPKISGPAYESGPETDASTA
jgi:hypothetical protein